MMLLYGFLVHTCSVQCRGLGTPVRVQVTAAELLVAACHPGRACYIQMNTLQVAVLPFCGRTLRLTLQIAGPLRVLSSEVITRRPGGCDYHL